jgi:lysyl-tRNA synthetase class 2
VSVRRPAAASLVAGAVGLVGLVGVVSALTPGIAWRSELVRQVLPPFVPEGARTVALASGLALVWLARSLARRKQRAWVLAVALVVGSAAAHLAKGLDAEEAAANLLVLWGLWRYRREFFAAGEPAVLMPLVRVCLALAAVSGALALRATDRMAFSDRIEDALALLAGGLAVRALYLWLRPLAGRIVQGGEERATAERLVRAQGRDSLSYFALRRDKAYFFSPSRRSFLAYRVVNGVALVSGDPIGDRHELADLLREFRRVAAASGWSVGVIGACEDALPLHRSAGLRTLYLGDEAIVDPAAFSLEGRAIRKVRQSVTRLRKAGYDVRIVPAGELVERERRELAEVSAEWRGNSPERGFSMAMDAVFAYPESVIALAAGPSGIGGFLHLVPAPAGGGWSLAAMRRRRGTPNGLMEFLVAETIAWAQQGGVRELSLNFALFGEVLRTVGGPASLRAALRLFDRFFQIERLLVFNRKFGPSWRRRYVCFERYGDLPALAVALARAEGQLTPPRPWARTVDLLAG